MGATMSNEDVASAAALMGVIRQLSAALQGIANAIGSAVAPVLIEYGTILVRVITSVSAWIRQNKDLVVSALEIGAVLAAAGSAFLAVGVSLLVLGEICGTIAAVITTGFSLASAAAGALVAVLGALFTPIGALFVALFALFGVLLSLSGLLDAVADTATAAFNEIKIQTLSVFTGIKDALAAGDIELAAQILWASLKVIWITGTNWLYAVWIGFAKGFITVVDSISIGFATAWDATVNFFYKVWNDAVGWLSKKFNTLAGTIQNVLAYFGVGEKVDIAAINKRIDAETARNNTESDASFQSANLSRLKQLDMDSHYGDSDLAAAQAELETSKAELKRLIDSAHDEAAVSSAPTAQRQIQAATPELDKIVKGDVIGTFNSSAVSQLGVGNSVGERIAKAAERIAQNTDPGNSIDDRFAP